jgi:hypothetical protein
MVHPLPTTNLLTSRLQKVLMTGRQQQQQQQQQIRHVAWPGSTAVQQCWWLIQGLLLLQLLLQLLVVAWLYQTSVGGLL